METKKDVDATATVYPQTCKVKPEKLAYTVDFTNENGTKMPPDIGVMVARHAKASPLAGALEAQTSLRLNQPIGKTAPKSARQEAKERQAYHIDPQKPLTIDIYSIIETAPGEQKKRTLYLIVDTQNIKPKAKEPMDTHLTQQLAAIFKKIPSGAPDIVETHRSKTVPALQRFYDETFECHDVKTGATVKPSSISFTPQQIRSFVDDGDFVYRLSR